MNARATLLVLTALAAFALIGSQASFLWTRGLHTPITEPDDFRAFYCAAKATIAGADPYLTEPLRTCEHAAAAVFGLTVVPSKFVLPAPLPPYALLALGPFGALPFGIASTLWFVMSIASLGVAIVATTRLARISPAVVAIAILISGAVSIGEGQLAPLIAAALCVAALAARTRRLPLAGIGLAVALLEPHIGIPALLCACVDARLRRTALVVAAIALAASLTPGGPFRILEYATRVLPAHASSEVDWYAQQFSLTTTLWALGASRGLAQALGAIDYLAMTALGIWTALRLRSRFEDDAFLVLVPPAFVTLGGSFIHIFQIETAVPLALVCLGAMPHRRALLVLALVCLAVPTQYVVNESPLADVFNLPVKIHAHASKPWNAEATQLAERTEMDHTGAMRTDRPSAYAETMALIPKVPTWFALVALLVACILEARVRRDYRLRSATFARATIAR